MSRLLAFSRRLAFAVAAVALVASWTASGARADVCAYAYAEETITLTSIPTDVTVTGTAPLSQTTANLDGANAGSGTRASLDAPQSLIGPGPGENSFVKFATFTPAGPPIPAGTPPAMIPAFARGDVLLSGVTGQAVSEVLLNNPGQAGGGDGNNHITYTFTTNGTAGARSIGYSFSNDRYTYTAHPGDSANGSFSFGVLLKQGATVLPVTGIDPLTTDTLSSPPNSAEQISSGTGTIVTPVLAANTTYTITFSLDANTNAVCSAVPEPATMAMVLTALPLLGFGLVRRHRNGQSRS